MKFVTIDELAKALIGGFADDPTRATKTGLALGMLDMGIKGLAEIGIVVEIAAMDKLPEPVEGFGTFAEWQAKNVVPDTIEGAIEQVQPGRDPGPAAAIAIAAAKPSEEQRIKEAKDATQE